MTMKANFITDIIVILIKHNGSFVDGIEAFVFVKFLL